MDRHGPSGSCFSAVRARLGEEIDEGKNRTIPLRRGRTPRASKRRAQQWAASVRAGAQQVQAIVFTPPRKLWLAGLGGTALTIRATQAMVQRLIDEGTALEDRLWHVLPESLRRDR